MFNHLNHAKAYPGCNFASKKHFHSHFDKNLFFKSMAMNFSRMNVPLNITEIEDSYIVEVFSNGFSKEEIKMSVKEDILTITGNKIVKSEKKFHRQEFPVNEFERSLILNGQVNIEKITAKNENGILLIALPKSEKAQKKEQKIEVQ